MEFYLIRKDVKKLFNVNSMAYKSLNIQCHIYKIFFSSLNIGIKPSHELT